MFQEQRLEMHWLIRVPRMSLGKAMIRQNELTIQQERPAKKWQQNMPHKKLPPIGSKVREHVIMNQ